MTDRSPRLSEEEAYTEATNKFYRLRRKQETLQRIARDEADAYGAEWDRSHAQVWTELEGERINSYKEAVVKQGFAKNVDTAAPSASGLSGATEAGDGSVPESISAGIKDFLTNSNILGAVAGEGEKKSG